MSFPFISPNEVPGTPTKSIDQEHRRLNSGSSRSPRIKFLPVMNVKVFDNVLKEDYLLKRREVPPLIGSIDQGTSSTRFLVFTNKGRIAASAQIEHEQIYHEHKAGWHEHDPLELFNKTKLCIEAVGDALKNKGVDLKHKPLQAVGITNQRETTIAWNAATGAPYYNAIVWDDTRTQTIAEQIGKGDSDKLRDKTGLPLASYFSGTKVKWLLDNVLALQTDLADPEKQKQVRFGTVDVWLIYQLTGGPADDRRNAVNMGGVFLTDVTNSSRWLFLNLNTLKWDQELVDVVCEPRSLPLFCLPEICPSSHVFGVVSPYCGVGYLANVPITGVMGDQQSALFGQTAFSPGEAKNTYGTGLFLMMNTGTKLVPSTHGLLTTVAYQLGLDKPVHFALEGSVSHSGSTIQWLRDQLQIISSAPDSETLATPCNDGLYFVPAFAGLFAPHWRSDARACLVGLTTSHHKGHVCRAALEAAAYQTREVFEAIERDSGVKLLSLNVDGGGTGNDLLMQFQSDMLNVDVVKPVVMETTALGVAFCAGLTIGVWTSLEEIKNLWTPAKKFIPSMSERDRHHNWNGWNKAVSKSLGWIDIEREATGHGDTFDDESFDDFKDTLQGGWMMHEFKFSTIVWCSALAFGAGIMIGTRRK